MNGKKKVVVGAGALIALCGAFLGGTAQADPVGAPIPRLLSGVGSETTQEVMNAMANTITIGGDKVIGSYNAVITPDDGFDTKNPLPPGATTCHYDPNTGTNGPGIRPNGSGAGRDRLIESLNPSDPRNGCLDFSRSSILNLSPELTYIPFALDGVAYAVRSDSTIDKKLSLASLKLIYQCAPSTTADFLPLLPQSDSGTRAFWLTTLGLTEVTKGACVKDTWDNDSNPATPEVPIEVNDGRPLLDKKHIAPFSAAQWAAQSIGVYADRRAKAVLGGIGGVPAIGVNAGGADVTYAVRSDSTINKKLSLASLKLIYQCDPSATANFLPLLPQSGSPIRASWLSMLGLTEATKGACVKDTWDNDSNLTTPEVPIGENDGTPLLDRKNIVPFSAAQWSLQSIGVIPDMLAKAVLGGIGGVPAIGVNAGGAATREVYNVVPTSRVNNPSFPELNQVFVGLSSLICQQPAIIHQYGFDTIANCGI